MSLFSFFVGPPPKIIYYGSALKCSPVAHGIRQIIVTSLSAGFSGIPILVLLITTMGILTFVTKARGPVQKQTVLTLLLMSFIFFICMLPSVVYFATKNMLTQEQLSSAMFRRFYMSAVQIVSLNFAVNPIIYCFSIRSFGLFIKLKLTILFAALSDIIYRRPSGVIRRYMASSGNDS